MSAGEVAAALVAAASELENLHASLIGADRDASQAARSWTRASAGTTNDTIVEAIRDVRTAQYKVTTAITALHGAGEKLLGYVAIVDPGFVPHQRPVQGPTGKQILDNIEDMSPGGRAARLYKKAVRKADDLTDGSKSMTKLIEQGVSSGKGGSPGGKATTATPSSGTPSFHSPPSASAGDLVSALTAVTIIVAAGAQKIKQSMRAKKEKRKDER